MIDLDQPSAGEPAHSKHIPSFEVLYTRYYPRVYRYLRARLDNDDDASDLTQQVFFQVWLHLHSSYQAERGSLATWIMSIAHHRLVDFYRSVHFSVSWHSLPEMTDTNSDPEELLLSAEDSALVSALLATLTPFEQRLLALRFVARLSIARIAALIGKSEEATKKQLARLLRRLQQQYRRQNLEDLLPDLLEPVLSISWIVLHSVENVPLLSTIR